MPLSCLKAILTDKRISAIQKLGGAAAVAAASFGDAAQRGGTCFHREDGAERRAGL